jgi:hypothetical protein
MSARDTQSTRITKAPRGAIEALVPVAAFSAAVGALVWVVASCSPPSDARIGVATPNETLFPPVSNMLAYRCGSLDCHGTTDRHFVIWSCYGLRLELDASPGCRSYPLGLGTTSDEYDHTYRSLVALEPALMSQVVQSGGANPDLLTIVQKARNEQEHKGGKLWDAGSPEDDCVAQWLADQAGTPATCKAALAGDLEAGTL